MSTIDYTQLRSDLINELALQSLATEKQDELIGRMTEALLKRIFLDTMERLGEQGMDEYEKLMESNPEEDAVAQFFESKIPEYNQFVAKIVEQFKKDIKAVATEA